MAMLKKISELCSALQLDNSDLFIVSQTDVNSTNRISRQLSVVQLWSEISSRFLTYDYADDEKSQLSTDRHHSYAYALSADVSSAAQLQVKFNTLSTYPQIRHQLSNDSYVLQPWVYTKDESNNLFALRISVYTKNEADDLFALSADVYPKISCWTKRESDENYYRKAETYNKNETYSKSESDLYFTLHPATSTRLGGVTVASNSGLDIGSSGQLELTPATKSSLGGIKVGTGLTVSGDGTVSTFSIEDLLDKIYPVGSIYLTLDTRNPREIFGFGLWQRIAIGKCLWGANIGSTDLGTLRRSGLPDITGSFSADNTQIGTSEEGSSKGPNGAFTGVQLGSFDMSTTASGNGGRLHFTASNSNVIYGRTDIVQPPAVVVNMWKRVNTIGQQEEVFTEDPTKTITDPQQYTETYTTTQAYSHSASGKGGNWSVTNKVSSVKIAASLPSGCGGSGATIKINNSQVLYIPKGKSGSTTLTSIAAGSTVSYNSGCSNHSVSVTITGVEEVTKTRTIWK